MENNNKSFSQENYVAEWVKNGLPTGSNGASFIAFSEKDGKVLQKITRTQFRNIFNEIRRIQLLFDEVDSEKKAIRALLKLKPKIAYIVKRFEKSGTSMKRLQRIINDAIDALGEKEKIRFNNLMDLFESLMAYHYANTDNK